MFSHDVSVIVASFGARDTLARCLEGLRAQETAARYEVVVVESSGDGSAELAADIASAGCLELVLLRCGERRFAGHARNLGIAAARGRLLAITDADCVAAPDWIERVVRAHESGRPVIGGVVDVANPECRAGWGYWFAEFHRWRPNTPAGEIDEAPGCCLSLTRDAFARWGPFLEGTYSSDTAFHWRMRASGVRPYLDPSIRVAHINPARLGRMLRHEVLHGRQFATVRASEQRLSPASLLLRAATTPLLPLLLFARVVLGLRRNPTHARRFAGAWPATLANLCAWSLGEALGYLASLQRPARSRAAPTVAATPVVGSDLTS